MQPVGARPTPLSPPEIAALTRLALSFCLGRGSLCTVTRSISLQLYQPRAAEEYIWYQWRRLSVYLPRIRQPRLHEAVTGQALEASETTQEGAKPTAAQWRLRVSSVHLQVAQRLLYPQPGSSRAFVTADALSLVGVEGMAALWADRGRLVQPRGNPHAQGRLNLSRYDWSSAQAIQQWMRHLTGAEARIAGNPRNPQAPMLFLDHQDVVRLLGNLGDTWMAQARCLQAKFSLRAAQEWSDEMMRERLAAFTPPPTPPLEQMVEEAAGPVPTLRTLRTGRRAPQSPPGTFVPSQAEREAS